MPNAYTGIWRSGTGPHYLWANATWPSFKAKWQELSKQDMRLQDLEVHTIGRQVRYTGIWERGAGGHYLWVNSSWSSFRAKWQELAGKNLRLTVLKTRVINGQVRYSGVWRPGTTGYYLWVNASWSSFKSKWQELSKKNMRLVDFDTVVIGGQRRYSGVWLPGTGGHYLWVNASWSSFLAKWKELAGKNLRLTVLKTHESNGKVYYSGVWRPGPDGYYLWANTRWANFRAKWQELLDKNLRLVHLDVRWARSVPTTPYVRLHVKVLTDPTIPINTMVERMRQVYQTAGIQVQVASTETLNLPTLNDVDVGSCLLGQTTEEQDQLFSNRNNVGENDIPIYFVRSTNPPYNGCAAHQDGVPAAVVARGASEWTLGHEVGHVLDLRHVNNNDRLMTGNGTGNITNPPPDLVSTEITTMKNHELTVDL